LYGRLVRPKGTINRPSAVSKHQHEKRKRNEI
jgi:hypothetical protein